ncbi:hypothetical protein O6H91_13G092300 [Diphasiastrum complanatum]|uniref:Uncharacterized protein n=3 Tax=Diphasiastrum complanatum TaxID=34168 RepID=A0ACC2BXT8_DIPCM|nr:hypothetical protein O6H91_13G090400 [Diphasiastrum complanatum]KAJ7534350.1 hypothetical protein O6H91_13G090400 [Diphasiastrum complanatum]KAJ7534399.1 hypothetical protein O6H91_13G092300 [Diphasiastrum complanatum]
MSFKLVLPRKSSAKEGGADEFYECIDVFEIPVKNPSLDQLRRWRKATLALNAARRFRYTLDLKRARDEEWDGEVGKSRTRPRSVPTPQNETEPPPEGFGINLQELTSLHQDWDTDLLKQRGGVEGIAKRLSVDLEKGIKDDPEELERRKNAFGSNTYPKKPNKNFFVFLWESSQDTTLIILMVAATLSLIMGMITNGPKNGWYDGASIAFAVILVILVTAITDYRQSLEFQSLSDANSNIQVQVFRGGRTQKVSIYTVVVGDLAVLNIGDQVPADGILVTGHSLSVDESSMTGESDPVRIDSKRPFLLGGCKVDDGYGVMLVTGVGINTEWGKIMATLSQDLAEETPLQVRLNGVATFIGKTGLTVAAIVFLMLFIRYFKQDYKKTDKPLSVVKQLVGIFSIAVTIVVVAVPEGLPLAVTLTLAYSMRKMMADQCLIRHLPACETMGSATTICTDKTGTLTMNQMTVVKAFVAGDLREGDDVSSLHDIVKNLILHGIAHNSSGTVFKSKEGAWEVSGSPTEKAILWWGVKIGMDYESLKPKATVLHVEAFNSIKKRAGVVVKLENGEAYVHWKGAAEIILRLCDRWVNVDGTESLLTKEKVEELEAVIAGMAAASLRCVALAYTKIDPAAVPQSEEETANWKMPETGLVLTSILGIKDPCRPGVREAVALCQVAGIKVRMVTGDNLLTAKAIAQECGILTPDGVVVEGKTFRDLTDQERLLFVQNLEVMARSSPTDKLLLVKTLKELGHVVAVTGDGTNDAPALHEADVGLAMGIAGTEVAKESADVIILDDDFTSVVKLVRWGRGVYANIQKFIQFQLTVNVVALSVNFVAACRSEDVPLNAVQLLWVNLIMDTLGALALATEPPTDELMKRTPVGRHEPLISNVMWRNIFGQAVYQIIVSLILYFRGPHVLRLKGDRATIDALNNTIIFNSFVFCQLFNEINSRKPEKLNVLKGIFRNRLFCGVLIVTTVLQVLIVEFLKNFFKTTKLPWQYWLVCLGIGFVCLIVGLLVKLIPVPQKPVFGMKLRKQCCGLLRYLKSHCHSRLHKSMSEESPARTNSTTHHVAAV